MQNAVRNNAKCRMLPTSVGGIFLDRSFDYKIILILSNPIKPSLFVSDIETGGYTVLKKRYWINERFGFQ